MRRVFAALLLLLGVPLLIAGAAAAAVVGPRGTVSAGTHRISTRGSAIVTSGSLLRYVRPTLHVTARTASGNGDVFVGVGHHADVQSYLAGSSYSTVTGFRPPWKVVQDQHNVGGSRPVPRPVGLPFWVASAHGPGQRELSWKTTDGNWNVVLTTATPSTGGQSFDVSVGLTVRYLFETLLAVAFAGLMLCGIAVVLLRRRRRAMPVPAGGALAGGVAAGAAEQPPWGPAPPPSAAVPSAAVPASAVPASGAPVTGGGAADAVFRAASGWPGRSAPLDPGESDDPVEHQAAVGQVAVDQGAVGQGAVDQVAVDQGAVDQGEPPETARGGGWGPPPPVGGPAPKRPPEAAHGDEWAPPPPAKPRKRAGRPKRASSGD